jgi:hypothetical protein
MSDYKKIIVVFIVSIAIFFFLFSCRKEPFSNAKEVKMRISSAMMQAKEGDAAESIQLVLDAVLLTFPQTDLPEEMENLVRRAAEALRSKGFPNQEVTENVLAAYRVMKPSFAGFGQTDVSSGVSSIAAYYETKLREAESLVDEGRPGSVIESLLEAILLTSPLPPPDN